MKLLLLTTVLVIATCGLIYELVAGALASYLLGDSVTQFSTIIGLYLFAMGCGSWLTRFLKRNLLYTFIQVELLIGIVGGTSALLLFLIFDAVSFFRVLLYGEVFIVGLMVGVEIPLLMRILRDQYSFEELVSQVFTFDYIGALFASLLFPLLLVPQLGLMQTSLLFGMINIAVGIGVIYFFRKELAQRGMLLFQALVFFVLLATAFVFSEQLLAWSERQHYAETVVYAKNSTYQRVVLTQQSDEVRLYLNGNLQFSTRDEHRYHEALVHPAMSSVLNPKRVLVLGGGDGLAVREILKYPAVDSVLLVDLDGAVTQLFSRKGKLSELNGHAFNANRVRVYNEDAFQWVQNFNLKRGAFDVVICDFPDPSSFSLGKLYSTHFYRQLGRILKPASIVVVQATSPWVARKSFWCINQTMKHCGFYTQPYHVHVPSFGEWGFVLASRAPLPQKLSTFPKDLKFLTLSGWKQMKHFPPDMDSLPVKVNRLNDQALVHYFEEEWANPGPR